MWSSCSVPPYLVGGCRCIDTIHVLSNVEVAQVFNLIRGRVIVVVATLIVVAEAVRVFYAQVPALAKKGTFYAYYSARTGGS